MKKQFESYYSAKWPWIWLFLSILSCVGIALFAFLWLETISVSFIVILSLCAIAFAFMFFKTKKQTGIALEIIDDTLILHKKETISVPIKDILKIDIHDADGSFDITIKTSSKKYSMHCFIKEQRKKKEMFIDYIKSKNINFNTYDLL